MDADPLLVARLLVAVWLVAAAAGAAVLWRRTRADVRGVDEYLARREPWTPGGPVTPAQLRALWEGTPPPPARFDGEGGYN